MPQLAQFRPRAVAWLIDVVPYVLVPSFAGRLSGSVAGGIIGFVATGVVWTIVPEGLRGWTPGKLFTGIRVGDGRTDSAGPPGVARAAVRWLVKYPVSGVLPVGYFWSLRDRRHRAWHDLAAGTVVIDARATT